MRSSPGLLFKRISFNFLVHFAVTLEEKGSLVINNINKIRLFVLAHGKYFIGWHIVNKSEQTLAGDFQHYTGTLYEDGSEFDSSIPRYFTIGGV